MAGERGERKKAAGVGLSTDRMEHEKPKRHGPCRARNFQVMLAPIFSYYHSWRHDSLNKTP